MFGIIVRRQRWAARLGDAASSRHPCISLINWIIHLLLITDLFIKKSKELEVANNDRQKDNERIKNQSYENENQMVVRITIKILSYAVSKIIKF